MAKPFKLWGLSLLNVLLVFLISIFGVLPIVTIPVTLTLSASMSIVYLNGYNSRRVETDQLFSGFKDFFHVAGGMCWKKLWLIIWLLIPIAGIVLYIIKSFSYAFTSYILIEKPSISATDALKMSIDKTKGYKGAMFVAVILPIIGFAVVALVLGLFSMIPLIGSLFAAINALFIIIYCLFINLFLGLVMAGFYDTAENATPIYRA